MGNKRAQHRAWHFWVRSVRFVGLVRSSEQDNPGLYTLFIVEARKLGHHYPHALKVK